MNEPLIAFCADRSVALPLAVAIRSLVNRSRSPLRIVVMTRTLTDRDQEKIRAGTRRHPDVNLQFFPPSRSLEALAKRAQGPESAFLRLLLPEMFPACRHLLYLDADILVRANVEELWHRICDSSAPLAACIDYSPTVSTLYDGVRPIIPIYKELGLPPGSPYYNSGVLGMNLELWRTRGLAGQIADFIEKYGSLCPFWDQAGLNVVLRNEIEPLDPLWNQYYFAPKPTAKIVHFVGSRKPFRNPRGPFKKRLELAAWHVAQRNYPFYQEYFRTLDETPYAGWRPSSPLIRLLELLPERWKHSLRMRRLKAGLKAEEERLRL